MLINFTKAQAYGNDFLFVEESTAKTEHAVVQLVREACDRSKGIGADGFIFYRRTDTGSATKLFNADGTMAEVSGNGVRCMAAILVDGEERFQKSTTTEQIQEVVVETDGGIKTLTLLNVDPPRYYFRAFMGKPHGLKKQVLDLDGQQIEVVVLSMGNPQCVVLTEHLNEANFGRLGPLLTKHDFFPSGTNVEFVEVERPDKIRILIWERGVGPTTSSGTGSCASAVAAAAYGGGAQVINVISPGGSQKVEWSTEGVYLTGWAEVTEKGQWFGSRNVDR